jgi:hypothetical protein
MQINRDAVQGQMGFKGSIQHHKLKAGSGTIEIKYKDFFAETDTG